MLVLRTKCTSPCKCMHSHNTVQTSACCVHRCGFACNTAPATSYTASVACTGHDVCTPVASKSSFIFVGAQQLAQSELLPQSVHGSYVSCCIAASFARHTRWRQPLKCIVCELLVLHTVSCWVKQKHTTAHMCAGSTDTAHQTLQTN